MGIKSVVLIGAGRVATQLGLTLIRHQIRILQVYSRSARSASKLAKIVDSDFTDDLSNLNQQADLYIISVTDDSIRQIISRLSLDNKIVVHTSGSVPMEILAPVSASFGVFYPLNTFSKEKNINLSSTPFCIEASDPQTEQNLLDLARLISSDVRLINSQQRAVIHLAAVFACNFTNFMMVNADEILKKQGISYEILLPLINETISKLSAIPPKEAQTGPALRNDREILKKHLEMLTKDPDKKLIYKLISEQIQTYFTTKQIQNP